MLIVPLSDRALGKKFVNWFTVLAQCEDAQLVVLDGYALVLNDSQIMPLPTDNQYQRIVLCGDPKYHNDEGLKSIMSDRNRMIIRSVDRSG